MTLCVLIAGGGTGGHLYPGIAVARELLGRDPRTNVVFVGTAAGIEARVIPREGFELELIRSAGLKGKSAADRLRGALLLPQSAIDAWRVISRRRPSVVVGVGGYSSGPVVATARLRGIPTLLMEQNAMPGLTNRALAVPDEGVRAAHSSEMPHMYLEALSRVMTRVRGKGERTAEYVTIYREHVQPVVRVLRRRGMSEDEAREIAAVDHLTFRLHRRERRNQHMAVKIRLTRVGSKKNPIYRVVVADSRSPRDGRFIEIVGRYNPQTEPSTIDLDEAKIKDWMARGAQPTAPVSRLIKAAGIS